MSLFEVSCGIIFEMSDYKSLITWACLVRQGKVEATVIERCIAKDLTFGYAYSAYPIEGSIWHKCLEMPPKFRIRCRSRDDVR